LAGTQNLHPNYLNNVIKKKTGKPISTWIVEKTLAEAKSLLQHSNVSIKEIALRLGFTEPARFNNYFKKYLHRPPGAYRKIYITSATDIPTVNNNRKSLTFILISLLFTSAAEFLKFIFTGPCITM